MNQTAVEWLIENSHIIPKKGLNKRELINQAKAMEKKQIINAFNEGESLGDTRNYTGKQYYNETFKSE